MVHGDRACDSIASIGSFARRADDEIPPEADFLNLNFMTIKIRKPVSPKATEVIRWSRWFQTFLILAFLLLMFGRSVIPQPVFAVLVLVLGTACAVLGMWALCILPPAIAEGLHDLNYHPDANVRALQRGEITIEEYVQRKANATPPSQVATEPATATRQSDT